MAERYEVVIDFAKYPRGAKVDLKNLGLPNNENYASTENVMRFEVASEATDISNNEVPSELNANMEVMGLKASQAVRTRTWTFDRSWSLGWTINGKIWDKNRVDANPALGDVEIWEFRNRSSRWFHPVQVHLVDFHNLSRKGNPPFGYEKGPKDVIYVGEDETLRVIARFGPLKAKYMIHCHNLVHEDHDMMTQEVATFADNVATKGFAVFFWRIELAAADADVVAHGNWQGVHHVSSLLGVLVLENFGQQIEERSPEAGVYGVQPTVEATFGDRLLDVTVLVQKRSTRLDVAAEECAGHKRYGHHLGGGQTDLRVVTVADGLQELLAQVVGGGYGIFHCVSSRSREKVLAAFGSGGYCLPG